MTVYSSVSEPKPHVQAKLNTEFNGYFLATWKAKSKHN